MGKEVGLWEQLQQPLDNALTATHCNQPIVHDRNARLGKFLPANALKRDVAPGSVHP
jgi:hypothetical protein